MDAGGGRSGAPWRGVWALSTQEGCDGKAIRTSTTTSIGGSSSILIFSPGGSGDPSLIPTTA